MIRTPPPEGVPRVSSTPTAQGQAPRRPSGGTPFGGAGGPKPLRQAAGSDAPSLLRGALPVRTSGFGAVLQPSAGSVVSPSPPSLLAGEGTRSAFSYKDANEGSGLLSAPPARPTYAATASDDLLANNEKGGSKARPPNLLPMPSATPRSDSSGGGGGRSPTVFGGDGDAEAAAAAASGARMGVIFDLPRSVPAPRPQPLTRDRPAIDSKYAGNSRAVPADAPGGTSVKRRMGEGRQEYANGDSYNGSWEDDQRHGFGTYTWANGAFYEGPFHSGIRHGKDGRYVDPAQGLELKGDWFEDELSGTAAIRNADGAYRGDVASGLPHGMGIMRYASGDEYRGAFRNGLRHGRGLAVLRASTREDRPGNWVDDEYQWHTDLPEQIGGAVVDAVRAAAQPIVDLFTGGGGGSPPVQVTSPSAAAVPTAVSTEQQQQQQEEEKGEGEPSKSPRGSQLTAAVPTGAPATADAALTRSPLAKDTTGGGIVGGGGPPPSSSGLDTQLSIVNPKVNPKGENFPSGVSMFDYVGQYFHDVHEDVFSAVVLPMQVTEHPDTVLRQIGLIRQTGYHGYFWRKLYYDDFVRRWRDCATNEKVLVADQKRDLYERTDNVPGGVICVVGTLLARDFESAEERSKREKARDRSVNELRAYRAAGKTRVRDLTASAGHPAAAAAAAAAAENAQKTAGKVGGGAKKPPRPLKSGDDARREGKKKGGLPSAPRVALNPDDEPAASRDAGGSDRKANDNDGSKHQKGGSSRKRHKLQSKQQGQGGVKGEGEEGRPQGGAQRGDAANRDTASPSSPRDDTFFCTSSGEEGKPPPQGASPWLEGKKTDSGFEEKKPPGSRATTPRAPPAGDPPRASIGGNTQRRQRSVVGDDGDVPMATRKASRQNRRDRLGAYDGYDVLAEDHDDLDLEAIVEIADPAREFLSKAEQLKFLRHYLTRGVVAAAADSGAAVITGGVDDVSRLLSIGFENILDRYGSKLLHVDTVPPRLVGINPMVQAPWIEVGGFTHQILLETDGGHAVQLQLIAGNNGHPSTTFYKCSKCSREVEPHQLKSYCPHDRSSKDRPPNSTTDLPTASEMIRFQQALLEALNTGLHSRGLMLFDRSIPPPRATTPIALVLIGGDTSSKETVFLAVAKGWPVVVVEGSGGFADVLSSISNKVNKLNPDAGPDDFRRLLGVVDAKTSEILINGKLTFVRPGTPVREFQRLVQDALKGDEILYKAWRLYALYRRNESYWSFQHTFSQLALLALGAAATFFSTLQTFLLLYWDSRGTNFTGRWTTQGIVRQSEVYMYLLYSSLQWLVILLPILLTLAMAVYQRMNPWAKYAGLRIAANQMLREIYMYRTRTLGYSQQAVKKEARKLREMGGRSSVGPNGSIGIQGGVGTGVGAAATAVAANPNVTATADDATNAKDASEDQQQQQGNPHLNVDPYASREELLGQMLQRIQNELAASEAKSVPLGDLEEAIPPPHIVDTGDSGLNDITPDDYVKFRLTAAKQEFVVKSGMMDKVLSAVTAMGYLWGALGTTMAALAAYGLGYLQAWVALTTALVNTMNRYTDVSRVQALTELSNQTVHRLSDIEGWWSALGTQADDDKNRSRLVSDTEGVLSEELEGWTKQLQRGQEELKKAQEDARRAREELKAIREGKVLEEVVRMKALGLDGLTPSAIGEALADPTGPAAQVLKKELIALNDKLGGVVKPMAVAAGVSEETINMVQGAVSKVQEAAATVDLAGTLQVAGTVVRAAAAGDVNALAGQLMEPGAGSGQLSAVGVLMDPKLHLHVFRLFQEGLLDTGTMSVHTMLWALYSYSKDGEVEEAIKTLFPTPKQVLDFVRQLVVEKLMNELQAKLGISGPQALPAKLYEPFVAHMSRWVEGEETPYETLCQLLRDPDIKRWCLTLPPQVAGVLSKVCREYLNTGNSTYRLLLAIARASAEYQTVNVMIDPTEASNFTGDGLERVRAISGQMHTLTTEEIVEVLPPPIQQMCAGASRLTVVCLAQQLLSGSVASRVFERVRSQLPSATLFDSDRGMAEQFVTAALDLDQLQANELKKGELLRALRRTPCVQEATLERIADELDEQTLRSAVSVLQAAASNTFASAMIDRVADYFSILDLRKLLSPTEKEILVRLVSAIPPVMDLSAFSKDQLLSIVPVPRVQGVLQAIEQGQLRQLFWMLSDVIENPCFMEIWDRVKATHATPAKKAIVDRMDKTTILRFVYVVTYMLPEDLQRIEDAPTVERSLAVLGDESVSQALISVSPDSRSQIVYATALAELATDVFQATRGVAMDVFWSRFTRLWLDTTDTRDHVDHLKFMLDIYIRPNLAEVTRLGVRQVLDPPPDYLRAVLRVPEDTIDHARAAGLVDADLLQNLVWTIATDLPYEIFVEIAQRITDFDLRDMVPRAVDRHRLSYVLAVLVLDESTAASFRPPDEALENLSAPLTDDVLPINRADMYTALAAMSGTTFDDVSSELRAMKMWQVRRLLVVATYVLTKTELGSLFCALCDAFCTAPLTPAAAAGAGEGLCTVLTGSEDFVVCDAAFRLQALGRSNVDSIQTLFLAFNVAAFLALGEADRRARLMANLADESLVRDLLAFKAEELRLLFCMLTEASEAMGRLQAAATAASQSIWEKMRQVTARDKAFGQLRTQLIGGGDAAAGGPTGFLAQAALTDHAAAFGASLGQQALQGAQQALDEHGEDIALDLAAKTV